MLPPRQAGRRRAQYAACIQVRYGKVDSEHEDIDAVLNMAPTDHATEIVPPAEEPEAMPLPSDANVIFLGGLFVLAMLAAAYVASEIVLPLVFAIVLKLLLQPALRILERLHVPPRGAASDPCVIRSDRRLGYRHFRPGPYLGSEASGGHSSA